MEYVFILENNPLFFYLTVGILGLLVGSFLNVVIYRLPIMLERGWKKQCQEILEQANQDRDEDQFDLVVPRSTCPHCGHPITALENVPILSFLALRGKCSQCKHPISPRYPIIEGVTALLSLMVAMHFGFGLATAAALVFTWSLICLTMIDFDHQLLPDIITLPVLWLGLFISLFSVFVTPEASIIGAISGYLVLWSIFKLHKLATGREGMGYGDFKLLALLGAWLGWEALPIVILLSSAVGAVVGISLILFRGRDRNIPIPFGPYLAAAGWISLLWGNDLVAYYYRISGFTV